MSQKTNISYRTPDEVYWECKETLKTETLNLKTTGISIDVSRR